MSEITRGLALREPEAAPTSRRSRLAASVLGLIVLVSLIPLAYGTFTALGAGDVGSLLFYVIFLLLPANLGSVGVVLTFRRPENRIGWLLLVAGALVGVGFSCAEYARSAIAAGQMDAPFLLPAAWIGAVFFIPVIGILVMFLPLLYPTGTLLSARWRVLVGIGIFGVSAGALGSALAPVHLVDPRGPLNPLVPPEPLATIVQAVSTISNVIAPPAFLLSLSSLLIRFRRSSGIERQQITWFLFVAAIAAFALALSILAPIAAVSDAAWALGIMTLGLLPIAIGIAILRYRLYEIDRIVNRALVYGAVTAILTGAFAAATALSQRLFITAAGRSSEGAIVLTTLIVVAVYAPVRKRVEAFVDRYFKYDQREYGPYLDELRRLLDLVEPDRAARRLAREVVKHTGATGVAVTGPDGAVLGSAGVWPAEPTVRVVIEPEGSPFAAVLVGPRRDGKAHSSARLRALAEAAPVAVAAVRRPLT